MTDSPIATHSNATKRIIGTAYFFIESMMTPPYTCEKRLSVYTYEFPLRSVTSLSAFPPCSSPRKTDAPPYGTGNLDEGRGATIGRCGDGTCDGSKSGNWRDSRDRVSSRRTSVSRNRAPTPAGSNRPYAMYAPTVTKRYRYSDSSPLICLIPR